MKRDENLIAGIMQKEYWMASFINVFDTIGNTNKIEKP